MPVSRSSFVVNHRVAKAGSKEKAAVCGNRVEYIDSRVGAVRDVTNLDAQLDRQRRELGVVGYLDQRPGSVADEGTALFSQDGPVALADARRALAESQGAVLSTVLSVRREDAEALRLTSKQDWERYVRANWPQEFARMASIPENRVRYVAAFHVNQQHNLHVHVLSWDSANEGAWNTLMLRPRMEATRARLTDAALAPELRRVALERTAARDRAVRAVRGSGASLRKGVALPQDGSLDYGHLRRYHPQVARRVKEVTKEAVSRTPEAEAAVREHEVATRRMAGLKGLSGDELERYVADTRRDLDRRLCNAAVSAMVPDRSARSERDRRLSYRRAPDSPSSRRRRERFISQEVRACVVGDERRSLLSAASRGEDLPTGSLRRCPTVRVALDDDATGMLASKLGGAAESALRATVQEGRMGKDTGGEAGDEAMRTVSHALSAVLQAVPGVAAAPARRHNNLSVHV